MKRGTVCRHNKFEFTDGQTGIKRIILLNTPVTDEPYLFCRTTSKQKYLITKEGCHSDRSIFLIKPHMARACFNCDSWVQLHEIFEADGATLLSDKFAGLIEIIGELDKPIIAGLVNCIKKTDDISQHHLDIIG